MPFTKLSLLVALAFAAVSPACAEVFPLPAPYLYVTGNYGLKISLPAGLYYCPHPDGWVGSDHGTKLFLARPVGCGAQGLPAISVFYSHNVAEYDQGDGIMRPPGTDAELRKNVCSGDGGRAPQFALLGRQIRSCVAREGHSVTVSANALYDLEHRADQPANILTVTLTTTAERLPADLVVFRHLLAA